jgi:hypothetical protein
MPVAITREAMKRSEETIVPHSPCPTLFDHLRERATPQRHDAKEHDMANGESNSICGTLRQLLSSR